MDNMKRFLAVGASAALLVSCMTGCGSTATGEAAADTTETAEEAALESQIGDVCETVLGMPSDTVVATVNGEDLTLLELAYWLSYDSNMLGYYYYGSMDAITWDDEYSDDMTVADFVKNDALDIAVNYKIIKQQCDSLGIELADEEAAAVEETMDGYVTSYGEDAWDTAVSDGTVVESDYDDDAKAAWIEENGTVALEKQAALYCTTIDYLRYMNEINSYYSLLEDHYYGEGGENAPTDETLQQYITDTPYYGASSILFMYGEDGDGNQVAFSDMDDDQKAALKAEAQAALDEILSADDPESVFEDYQANNNDDTGSAYAGASYIFTSGEMVEAYETAVASATEGEFLPELVESEDYGYFIVKRNAVTADDVPTDYESDGTTIRQVYINDSFSSMITTWNDEAEIVTNENFDAIDMATFAANLLALNDTLYPSEETTEETATAETAAPAEETEAATTETASN